jgi:hypothetical protein
MYKEWREGARRLKKANGALLSTGTTGARCKNSRRRIADRWQR